MQTKDTFTLSRTAQCKTCLWRIGNSVYNIPGYNVALHEKLVNTIAKDCSVLAPGGVLNIMSCHYSKEGAEQYCIGWLKNQLGPGNNIPLRIAFMRCTNASKIKTIGEQHETFEDTLPL